MFALQQATLNARKRLNDNAISVSVEQGLFRVELVTFDERGKGNVQPISASLSLTDAIAFLNAMEPAKCAS